jgi:ABC-type multidrug transport system ATPase subunit
MLSAYTIDRVTKIYPGQSTPANREISLEIAAGEIFGFLGDNGAGKTTLVRQMVNLLKSSAGTIALFGRPVDSSPLHVACNVGYMPQEAYSLNNLTVGEALYYTARLRGLSHADSRRERDRLLDAWQVGDLRDRVNSRLSVGQRRLLRLAVTMTGSPPVLILDEPTNDLDPQRRKLVWDLLRAENAGRGTTVIFITHDAIEAEKIIQRVGILHCGELVAVGSPAVLKRAVDRKLRLELLFSPDAPPRLPAGVEVFAIQPGRWLVYLDWQGSPQTLSTFLDQFDLSQVDDFRLYSATLEDLYLYYAQSPT